MSCRIYALFDPRDGTEAPRYIGKTTQKLEQRLRLHIIKAKRGEKTHKATWIRLLIKNMLLPCIKLVEELSTEDTALHNERECYWIEEFRKRGCDLTNSTIGGEGCTPTDNTRKRMREAQLGHYVSEETKQKISASLKGRKLSREHKEKIRQATINGGLRGVIGTAMPGSSNPFYGKKHSDEAKEKMRAAKKGKSLSEEHKQKLRLAKLKRKEIDDD